MSTNRLVQSTGGVRSFVGFHGSTLLTPVNRSEYRVARDHGPIDPFDVCRSETLGEQEAPRQSDGDWI